MIKLEEGLVGDYRADWTKPGPKSVFKQSSQLLKKETVVCTDFKKGKRVRTSYICEHCNVCFPWSWTMLGKLS